MSQSKKLTPNLDQQSTKVLNLTVLQRIDPFIDEILFTAAHVSFYDFNIDTNQWVRFVPPSLSLSLSSLFSLLFTSHLSSLSLISCLQFCGCLLFFQSRKDVEGSLFVVKRSSTTLSPSHSCALGLLTNFPQFYSILFFRNAQPRFQFIVMNRRNTGSDLCFFLVNSFWCVFRSETNCQMLIKIHSKCQNLSGFVLLSLSSFFGAYFCFK